MIRRVYNDVFKETVMLVVLVVSACCVPASGAQAAVAAAAAGEGGGCAPCLRVGAGCYNVTHLLELTAPFRTQVVIHQMAVARSDNTLYYSFEPAIQDAEYYKVAFVKLDRPDSAGTIAGPSPLNFVTFDIDQDEGTVYLGGSNGIYRLHSSNLTFYSSLGHRITYLLKRQYLYFTQENSGITRKKEDEFIPLLENNTVKKFLINKDFDYVMVVSNTSGLFAFNNRSGEQTRLSRNPFLRGLCLDRRGRMYAWWVDGIYTIHIDHRDITGSRLVRIAHIDDIGAMTFDNNDDILFTVRRGLYRLTETAVDTC